MPGTEYCGDVIHSGRNRTVKAATAGVSMEEEEREREVRKQKTARLVIIP